MKLAIMLYGMFRSDRTPLFWDMLPPGDVFVFATYTPSPFTQRSFDKPVPVQTTFTGITRATYLSVVDQEMFDERIGLAEQVKGRRDIFTQSVNQSSLRNAVRALHLIERLISMVKAHPYGYTHAIVSRVDVLFTRPVPPPLFAERVIVPDYAHWMGGTHDRFMAGPLDLVLPLMRRVEVWNSTGKVAEETVSATSELRGIRIARLANVGYTRRVRVGGTLMPPQYRPKLAGCPLDTAAHILHLPPADVAMRQCCEALSRMRARPIVCDRTH